MRVVDSDFDNILSDERSYKTYENILTYGISYKNLMGEKPLHISFDKVDVFIKIYDGTRYLVLISSGWYDEIYNRIRFLISERVILHTDSINHNFARIRIDSYNSLLIEKIPFFS